MDLALKAIRASTEPAVTDDNGIDPNPVMILSSPIVRLCVAFVIVSGTRLSEKNNRLPNEYHALLAKL